MMQKTYLSRAVTRAMALDHPVGDPFGGAAYGERNDPISAVISIGTMAGTYAAAGSFAAMTLMQGLTFAGAALSLAGNVTGNRTLSKIGMVAGLAGGVGMLAESITGSTIGGTLGETFGFGGEAAKSASGALSQSAAVGSQAPVVDGVQVNPVTSAASPTMRELGPLGMADDVSTSAASLNAGPGAGAAGVNTPGGATSALNASPVSNGPFTAQTSTGLRVLPSDPQAVTRPGVFESLRAGNFMDAAKGAGSSVMDLAKNNPGAAYMLGNAASGVADWLSGKTDAEIAYLENQASAMGARGDQIRFEIEREKQRRANLNAGYVQVNQSLPVNPNASIPMPWAQRAQQAQQPGLIAGARG